MTLRSGLWTEVTTSDFTHERAALAWIREVMPDREPFRAWANFTFIADDGTRNEVDLLVVTPTGVYVVEIKSHPGRMDGDAGRWLWRTPDGKRRALDNPLLLTELKAKRLKFLLLRQKAFRRGEPRRKGIYVKAVVFLSNPDLDIGLNTLGRTDVYGPDADDSDRAPNGLPGLRHQLVMVDPQQGARVDRPLSKAIALAVEQAGIRESIAHRRVGNYMLQDLLEEGEGWQDFIAEQPGAKGTYRRIRIYLAGMATTEEERELLERAADREFRYLQDVEHAGIDQPVNIIKTPRGPALVFKHDRNAQRLDTWLAENDDILDVVDRVDLVRQLAEIMRFAHRQGLYHRALTPRHISVTERRGKPILRIRDWQTASREFSPWSTSGSGTQHVTKLVAPQAHVYLAPETFRLTDPEAVHADMWSLGAVAFLILTGRAPAESVETVHDLLREQGGLSLALARSHPGTQRPTGARTGSDRRLAGSN